MAPAPSAKTERLMNLVMTLLWTRRPLTRHEIRQSVEQYTLAPSDDAFSRMFERDKDELRELGVPVQTVEADAYFEDESAYRISSDEYVLPEIEFDPDELVVLGLAARTWSDGRLGGAAAQGLRKLLATRPDSDETPVGLVEPRLGASEPTFPDVLRAVQELREIRFDYRRANAAETEQRHIQPWGMQSIKGHWYVTGFDLVRDEERVFRLSRISGPVKPVGKPGAYAVPDDTRPAELALAAAPREQGADMEVSVAAGTGARLRRDSEVLDEGSLHDTTEGEWTRLLVRGMGRDAAVAEVAGLLEAARNVTPDDARDEVVVHLYAALEAHEHPGLDTLIEQAATVLTPVKGRRPRSGEPAIEPATQRLSRLLSMVPWLVHRQGIDLAEAATGLGVSEDQLRSDLELLFMCGYGSMPDQLIDVESESGQIFIHNAETIARPLRLGWDEALTLIVGLRALAGVPGLEHGDAVDRALDKLENAAGGLAAAASRVSARVDEGLDAATVATLRSALKDSRRVHLVYEGAEKDERTERDVDVMRVVSSEGRWYVEGWCHLAQDTRLFRIDRIREVHVLDVDGTPPPQAQPRDLSAGTFQAPEDALTATILLRPGARWIGEYYPVQQRAMVEEGPAAGSEVIVLQVTRSDWLIRLLVRQRGEAILLEPASLREELVSRARTAREHHAT